MLPTPAERNVVSMPHVSARYADSRVLVSGVIASTQISMRPLPPSVRACTPFDRRLKHPSSMYQTASDSGVSSLK